MMSEPRKHSTLTGRSRQYGPISKPVSRPVSRPVHADTSATCKANSTTGEARAIIALLLLPVASALVLLALTPILARAADGSVPAPATVQAPIHRAAPPVPPTDLPDIPAVELGKRFAIQRCGNCHALDPASGKSFAAPLHDLFGRRSGTIEGYQFTPNMKALAVAWSPKTLSDWLAATTFDTPDIRMRHVGLPEPRSRAALIAYLSTLQGNSAKPAP